MLAFLYVVVVLYKSVLSSNVNKLYDYRTYLNIIFISIAYAASKSLS